MSQGHYLPSLAHIQNTKLKKKKKSLAITSFRWWNWVLLEMIPNVTVCVCVRVCGSQGGCSDSLRLHSSVCIWSRPNEAESLAVVRCICRAKEWWASHSAAVSQGGNTHLRTLPAVCTVIPCPCVPMLQKVIPHMLWMPSGRSVWLPHKRLIPPWTGDITSSETDQVHVFGKFNCQVIFLIFCCFLVLFCLFTSIPPHVIQYSQTDLSGKLLSVSLLWWIQVKKSLHQKWNLAFCVDYSGYSVYNVWREVSQLILINYKENLN